jgi:hypothetical protein
MAASEQDGGSALACKGGDSMPWAISRSRRDETANCIDEHFGLFGPLKVRD